MALLWRPGSCRPHRWTAASTLSLLLFYSFSLLFSHSSLFTRSFLITFSFSFAASFLYFPLCLFSVISLSLSLCRFCEREGWAPWLLIGSSSRIWRRKEVGVPFHFLTSHLPLVIKAVIRLKRETYLHVLSVTHWSIDFVKALYSWAEVGSVAICVKDWGVVTCCTRGLLTYCMLWISLNQTMTAARNRTFLFCRDSFVTSVKCILPQDWGSVFTLTVLRLWEASADIKWTFPLFCDCRWFLCCNSLKERWFTCVEMNWMCAHVYNLKREKHNWLSSVPNYQNQTVNAVDSLICTYTFVWLTVSMKFFHVCL